MTQSTILLNEVAISLASLSRTTQALASAANASTPGAALASPLTDVSSAGEQVLVYSAAAAGKVRSDGKGITVEGALTLPDGRQAGTVLISWESLARSATELTTVPFHVAVTSDEQGPIEKLDSQTLAKGQWTFANGTITAVGSGVSDVETLNNDQALARDSVAMKITDGTGAFEGASGLISVVGSVALEPGQKLFNNPGVLVTQNSIHAIRLTTKANLKT